MFSFSSFCFKSETEVEIGASPSSALRRPGAQTMDNPWLMTTEPRKKSNATEHVEM